MMDKDTKESLDALIATANEAGEEWKEDILAFVEEDLFTSADEDMQRSGIEDADERDAVKAIVEVKALYLAYQSALEDLEDPEVRAYLRAAVEGFTPMPKLTAVPAPTGAPPAGFKAPVLK